MLLFLMVLPATFGNVSKKVLQMFLNNEASTVIIAFDIYKFPSIKDYKHEMRGLRQSNFCVRGPEQLRPADFTSELKNVNFKEALINFFIVRWAEDHMAEFIRNKRLYVNYDQCYKYEVIDQHVRRTLDNDLSCPAHEEADTKVVYHACKLDANKNVAIRCSDTDICVIMLANMNHLKENVKITIECGVRNHRRFIDVSKLYEVLGANLSIALAGFHAFTGCDFNATFHRKGKLRHYKLLKRSKKYIEAFQNIYTTEELDNVFIVMREFVCDVYTLRKLKNINEARAALFLKKFKPSEKKTLIQLIAEKSVDPSSLPPCESELYQQFLRSSYITDVWVHAHKKVPTSGIPEERGWKELENKLVFNWLEGEQLPASIDDIKLDQGTDNIDDGDEELSEEYSEDSNDEEPSEITWDVSDSEQDSFVLNIMYNMEFNEDTSRYTSMNIVP